MPGSSLPHAIFQPSKWQNGPINSFSRRDCKVMRKLLSDFRDGSLVAARVFRHMVYWPGLAVFLCIVLCEVKRVARFEETWLWRGHYTNSPMGSWGSGRHHKATCE